jgi:phosphoribosylglycinamide formyltransferase-1
MPNPARLVVLISGNGTNLQAILDACATGTLPAMVAAVISNKRDAYGLVRAARAGVPTTVLTRSEGQEREAYDAVLGGYVASYRPDYVILAGWMRILTPVFLARFPNRVVNLHPALPGAFPGTHSIERAYQAWQKGEIDHTGIMVHLVPDQGVDSGPVLATREIPFRAGEPIEVFEERLHAEEHTLLIHTLKKLLDRP